MQFFGSDLSVVLQDNSDVTLNGGGNPLVGTVDFQSFDSILSFTNETVADVTAEHLGKFTVFGAAAVVGSNVTIFDDGGITRVQALNPIPEPSAAILLAGGLGMAISTRRRKS